MADEQPKKPSQPFFIGGKDQNQQGQEQPQQVAPSAPAQNAMWLMEQARLKQEAEQRKLAELRQVGFQVELRHRQASNSLVTSTMWAAGGGILLGLVLWWVTR